MSVLSNYEPEQTKVIRLPPNGRYNPVQRELLAVAHDRMCGQNNEYTRLPGFKTTQSDYIPRHMTNLVAVTEDTRTLFIIRGAMANLAGNCLWESRHIVHRKLNPTKRGKLSQEEADLFQQLCPTRKLPCDCEAVDLITVEELETEVDDLIDAIETPWTRSIVQENIVREGKDAKNIARTLFGEEPKKRVTLLDVEKRMEIPILVGHSWEDMPREKAILWLDFQARKNTVKGIENKTLATEQALTADYAKLV